MAKKKGKPRGTPGDAERMARMREALAARRARLAGADLVEVQRGEAGAGERDLLRLGSATKRRPKFIRAITRPLQLPRPRAPGVLSSFLRPAAFDPRPHRRRLDVAHA